MFGILPKLDWYLNWSDLTESSMAEKIDRAAKMASINAAMPDELVFLVEEIRAVLDLDPAFDMGDNEGDDTNE